jgi:hypothetical protein
LIYLRLMSWLIFSFWLLLFITALKQGALFQNSGLKFRFLLVAFLLKIVAGIGLTLFYTHYHTDRSTADIWKNFDDAQVIWQSGKDNPMHYLKLVSGIDNASSELEPYIAKMKNWSPQSERWLNYSKTKDFNLFHSNRIMTRFNALLLPLSFGNIFTHVLWMCFLTVTGLTAFFRLIKNELRQHTGIAALLIFLLPSTLIWCSGVLKDGLILTLLCILLYLILSPVRTARIMKTVILVGSAIGLCMLIVLTKYYVLVALVPSLFAFTIMRISGRKFTPGKVYTSVIGLFVLTAIATSYFNSPTTIWTILSEKREEGLKSAIWGDAKHQLFYDRVAAQPAAILAKVPEALINTLFRPTILESLSSPVLLPSGIENLFLMAFFIYVLFNFNARVLKSELFFFFIYYCLVLAFIIGFTTPVTGGIVRYKTAVLPFLLVALLICLNSNAQLSFHTRLNKLILV